MNNISREKVKISNKEEDYSQWFLEVAKKGEMYEDSPTPGCITFLPKAESIWSKIRNFVSKEIKKIGVQDIYLPLLIPYNFLEKEKDHVEGFSPELAIVTIAGDKELSEKLVIRPTSETLFCDFFKKRLNSYRDLPMLYNQWVNVMRWEKRTRPFLRTAEFYWQEGHTIHESYEDASDFVGKIHNKIYIKTIKELLAIDGVSGEKSPSERFAGADHTFTFESMMSNGWALQMATSHLLSRGFMKQFDVTYLDRNGKQEYPYYTSWGLSTRLIGAMISSHGDDRGVIIPPRLSEYSAVLLPIYGKENRDEINSYLNKIGNILTSQDSTVPVKGDLFRSFVGDDYKLLVDYRDSRLGEKINDFEISGYPVRIECGARDIENQSVVMVSRITGEKKIVKLEEIKDNLERMLNEGQKELFDRSSKRLKENTFYCKNMQELGEVVSQGKMAIYDWDGSEEFEKEIKERFKATIRCIPEKGQFTDELMGEIKNTAVFVGRNF